MNTTRWIVAALGALATGCLGEGTSVVGGAAPLASNSDAGSQASETSVAQPRSPANVATKPAESRLASPQEFVVHEWGTFTSVQGSNGATLDGLHHEDEHLPGFVYGRSELFQNQHGKEMEGLPEPCNQKMETPVVYFYSALPRDVKLSVTFAQGVISQWFPAAVSFLPELGALGTNAGQKPTSMLRDGRIDWHVQVGAANAPNPPWVPLDSIWLPAREAKASAVRFTGKDHHGQAVDQTEDFLFYRGLGRFDLPVRVLAQNGGGLTLRNDSPDELPFAVLLRSTADGHGGVQAVGKLSHGETKAQVPAANLAMQDAVEAAKTALKVGLVQSGLFDDEAQAMVDTWQRSWFASPGVRLLYVLPRPWTDKLLPMTVSPAPDKLVRTLVGRIEILTPEVEQETVAKLQADFQSGSYPQSVGERFFEPRVRRACQLLYDAKAKQFCDQFAENLQNWN